MIRNLFLGIAVAAAMLPSFSQAATLFINDNDPATMTFIWDGFDGGFFIDGGSDLGAAGSLTLPDGGHTLLGAWTDLTPAGSDFQEILFALASAPTFVTSGIQADVTFDGSFGTLGGISSTGGFTGGTYFIDSPTVLQDGHVETATVIGLPGLGITFDSEAPEIAVVPEPASLTLVGMGAVGLIVGAYRRRRQAA